MKRSRFTVAQIIVMLREQESEVNALFIEPGLPGKDGHNESLKGKPRGA